MNKALIAAILDVVETKIALAIERDHGRDYSIEWSAEIEAQKKLDSFFDPDTHELLDVISPTPENLPIRALVGQAERNGKPTSISELFLAQMPRCWWLHKLAENRTPILYRGDVHTPDANPNLRWVCELQHDRGGLLTTAYGSTAYSAFRHCCAIVEGQHGNET